MSSAWKKDALVRGCISGLLAGMVKNLCDFGLIILKVKSVSFWKMASVIIFSKPPAGYVENTVAVLIELIFCSFIGVVYTILRIRLKTSYYAVMGFFYGALVWFFIKASFLLFHVTELRKDLSYIVNPISHLILSILYGLILAYLEHRWTGDQDIKSP